MYDRLWAWIAENNPNLKTIYGGTETDQGHSNGTYSKVIVQAATRHGFTWATGDIEGLTGDIASGYKEVLNNSSNWLQADAKPRRLAASQWPARSGALGPWEAARAYPRREAVSSAHVLLARCHRLNPARTRREVSSAEHAASARASARLETRVFRWA